MSKMRGTACYVRQVQNGIPRRGALVVMSKTQRAGFRVQDRVVQHVMSDRYRMVFQDAGLWLLCPRPQRARFCVRDSWYSMLCPRRGSLVVQDAECWMLCPKCTVQDVTSNKQTRCLLLCPDAHRVLVAVSKTQSTGCLCPKSNVKSCFRV